MTETPYNKDNPAPTPNVWFKTQIADIGPVEVSAYVPISGPIHRKDIVVVGIGSPDDLHVSPEEVGLSPRTLDKLKMEALANLIQVKQETAIARNRKTNKGET